MSRVVPRRQVWHLSTLIGSWGYNKHKPYTTADTQTDKLIDIVSKNGNQRIGEIKSVELLGHGSDLKWEHHLDGLRVWFPKERPCQFAYCLKIHLPQK